MRSVWRALQAGVHVLVTQSETSKSCGSRPQMFPLRKVKAQNAKNIADLNAP